jgi:hypothetical protein
MEVSICTKELGGGGYCSSCPLCDPKTRWQIYKPRLMHGKMQDDQGSTELNSYPLCVQIFKEDHGLPPA